MNMLTKFSPVAILLGSAMLSAACADADASRAQTAQVESADSRLTSAQRAVGFRELKRLSLELSGPGKADEVLYGMFGKSLASGNRQIVIRNLASPSDRATVRQGDYGLLLVSADPREPALIYPSGELEYFQSIGPGDRSEFAECWQGQGKKRGVFAGTETANGVIHYAKGWRWSQCGD